MTKTSYENCSDDIPSILLNILLVFIKNSVHQITPSLLMQVCRKKTIKAMKLFVDVKVANYFFTLLVLFHF